MHWLKTATVMMKPTLQSATLMVGIAVELVSILNTVLNVIVLGKTLVLWMLFWVMASVRMRLTMDTVCLIFLIVVNLLLYYLETHHFAQSVYAKVCTSLRNNLLIVQFIKNREIRIQFHRLDKILFSFIFIFQTVILPLQSLLVWLHHLDFRMPI